MAFDGTPGAGVTLGQPGLRGSTSAAFNGTPNAYIESAYAPTAAAAPQRTYLGWANLTMANAAYGDVLIGRPDNATVPTPWTTPILWRGGSTTVVNRVLFTPLATLGTGASAVWPNAWAGRANVWTFWCVTFDNATRAANLYIDGTPQPENPIMLGTTAVLAPTPVGAFRLGGVGSGGAPVPGPTYWLNGRVQDVAVFERVLTPAEIAGLWQAAQRS